MNRITISFALLLALIQTPHACALEFQRVVIDDKPPANPWIKIVGDLNNDGKPDIIIGGSNGPLVWYRNPDWQKFQIAKEGYNSVGGAVTDIDRDGDLDIALGGGVWFENPGPNSDPANPTWTAHQVEKRRGHDIAAADLDGDGKVDLVMRDQSSFGSKLGHSIFIYSQASPTNWAARELHCPEGEGLQVADLNGDGRPDIVIGGRWFENSGDVRKGSWTEHLFTTEWNYLDTKIAIGDLNGDLRPDIILAPAELKGGSHRLAWYEAPVDARSGSWKEHIVESPVETVMHALAAADFDRDGKLDLVAARMHQGASPQEVAVYLNGGGGQKWNRQVISTTGSHDIVARDVDGDGRPDVLGANHGGPFQPVELWLNRAPVAAAGAPAQSQTALGIEGSRFTLNGATTFLLGFSYYGALGATEDFIRRDLDDFQRHGFNWLRVWATWDAHGVVVSAVNADGEAREPFFSKLLWLVAECDRRGMVVDITLARHRRDAAESSGGQVPNFAAHQRTVETLCTALKASRNWYLDLANERDVRDRRFVGPDELKRLRERVRELDPARLVTASCGGHDLNDEDIREALLTIGLDFLSPHRPRTPQSPRQTENQTRSCLDIMRALGRVAPVHHQEPFRRGYGQWEPAAADFLTDLRGAVAGGAAGWCLHNGSQRGAPGEEPRRSFDLRARRLWDQLDSQERQLVDRAREVVRNRPYPPSPVIRQLHWDAETVKIGSGTGDNWPITWVGSDLQITSWGDGPGFDERPPRLSLGFARIFGNPPAVRGEDFATDADTREGGGSSAIKASGLHMVDGTLYLWVRNYRTPGLDDFTNARLAWSRNGGTNWTWADWHFADTFGCPEFVQFGPNYAGARDNYVYVASQANDSAYGYSPDIVLARVPKQQLSDRSQYEFFAGANAGGQPVWSRDLEQRQPIFIDPNGTQRIAITYSAGLKRYLLTSSHRPPGSTATHTAALGVFDAPEPWGPWTTVSYDSQWSATNRTYHHKFPTKWMSADGRTLWLLYSGLDGGLYTFCLKKATLEISTSSRP